MTVTLETLLLKINVKLHVVIQSIMSLTLVGLIILIDTPPSGRSVIDYATCTCMIDLI